jgi:hypothetical protein
VGDREAKTPGKFAAQGVGRHGYRNEEENTASEAVATTTSKARGTIERHALFGELSNAMNKNPTTAHLH